jgi:GTPase
LRYTPISGTNLPSIAIVGRPNVGKSTLFNRLIRKRKAITDSTPGVTRDIVDASIQLAGRTVRLADTGGVTAEGGEIQASVTERSYRIIEESAVILLMVDVTEVTGEDEEFLETLRPHRDKCILVVNKVDNPQREAEAWNFFTLGFPDTVGISAEHGVNLDELYRLMENHLESLPESSLEEEPVKKDDSVRIAILGQPNTGKSTLLNTLTGSERSLVTNIPGTTRDVVESQFNVKGRKCYILDTAGIRRKSKVREAVEYYSVNRAIGTIDEADVVLLMIDTEKGFVEQDKKIAHQAAKKGKGIIIVLNKWDLMGDMPNAFNAVSDRVRFLFPVLDYAPIAAISAKKGDGMDKLMRTVFKVYEQLNRHIETGLLNRKLNRWTQSQPPPFSGRQQIKIKYITQVSEAPLHFLAFKNTTKKLPESYERYLINCIRKDLGFSSVPVFLDFKTGSQNPYITAGRTHSHKK